VGVWWFRDLIEGGKKKRKGKVVDWGAGWEEEEGWGGDDWRR